MIATLDSGVPDALVDRPRAIQEGVNAAFVFVGRLIDLKGCDLAIRALARVDRDATLDVIGDGEQRGALEALAAELGVADRVRFVGWIAAGPSLYDRFARYRALVMPTLAEANGIAVQEAMVLGIPIICVDWAGPAELLTEQEAVMLAPDGEEAVVAGVARAMAVLARDGAAAQRLALAARAKAEAMGFRWRELLAQWLAVYDRAIAERRAG